jgi:hypothetical protein
MRGRERIGWKLYLLARYASSLRSLAPLAGGWQSTYCFEPVKPNSSLLNNAWIKKSITSLNNWSVNIVLNYLCWKIAVFACVFEWCVCLQSEKQFLNLKRFTMTVLWWWSLVQRWPWTRSFWCPDSSCPTWCWSSSTKLKDEHKSCWPIFTDTSGQTTKTLKLDHTVSTSTE